MYGHFCRKMVLCLIATGGITIYAEIFVSANPSDSTTGNDSILQFNKIATLPQLEKIVVRASRQPAVFVPAARPVTEFDADDVLTAAGAAEDISRYLASLPQAVASLGENFDNALYVRGGRPSEVVFVVDGIEFENINHFSRANSSGGPVGFINSDFVKNVRFFAGNAPVAYPSRLSSVVDVEMKGGTFSGYRHSLGCKLTGGMFSSEGPFAGGNGSYAVAGRYIDFSTLRRFIGDRGIPRLGDCYFKGVLAGNDRYDLSVTGLGSYSTFDFSYPVVEADDISGVFHENAVSERQRIIQGGAGITGRVHNGTLSNRTTIACSFRRGENGDSLHDFGDTFFSGRYTANPIRREHDNRLRLTASTVGDWKPDSQHTVTMGVRLGYQHYRFFTGDYRFHNGRYVVCTGGGPLEVNRSQEPRLRGLTLDAGDVGGHLEYSLQRGILSATLGARTDYYGLLGKVAFSPKGTVGIDWKERGSLRASGGIQHQFPTDMPSLFFYFFSFDTTMDDQAAAATTESFLRQLEPLRCYQAALDYELRIVSRVLLQTGIYYKWYDREYHYVSPKIQEVFIFDDALQPVLSRQNGRRKSFGVEVMLSGEEKGLFTYSAGGSLFDVKNRYSDGKWYDDWTNIRYTGALSAGVRLLHRHHVSVSARVNGGRPYCPEIIVADCIGRKSSVFEPRQQYYSRRFDRLFATHARYGCELAIRRCTMELFVEVINVFNSQPVLEYRFNGVAFQEIKPFGIMPIIGGKITW